MSPRPHTAEEVYVTGTFDNWSKSEQLEKVGDVFEKKVILADASEKIYYKVRTALLFSFESSSLSVSPVLSYLVN